MKTDKEVLIEIISTLHDLKHEGKLPKKLNTDKYLSFIEFFNPEDIIIKE